MPTPVDLAIECPLGLRRDWVLESEHGKDIDLVQKRSSARIKLRSVYLNRDLTKHGHHTHTYSLPNQRCSVDRSI
jgi:hypothetical protein